MLGKRSVSGLHLRLPLSEPEFCSQHVLSVYDGLHTKMVTLGLATSHASSYGADPSVHTT